MKNDFSEENQYNTYSKYEPLLCDRCKDMLKVRMIPIKKDLDKGRVPKIRHLVRLQQSLCVTCHRIVVKTKMEEAHKK